MAFETVFAQVGMEPSGDAFNAMGKLEAAGSSPQQSRSTPEPSLWTATWSPRSPLTKCWPLPESCVWTRRSFWTKKVYHSEMSNISRNRAIAYLLENKGVIRSDVERTLDFLRAHVLFERDGGESGRTWPAAGPAAASALPPESACSPPTPSG